MVIRCFGRGEKPGTSLSKGSTTVTQQEFELFPKRNGRDMINKSTWTAGDI
jgi:hypothetical protein